MQVQLTINPKSKKTNKNKQKQTKTFTLLICLKNYCKWICFKMTLSYLITTGSCPEYQHGYTI